MSQRPVEVPAARIAVGVFLPFAFGYFLSYLSRVVNAVIADDLSADIGVDSAGLGVLTAAYFIAFAAFQLPLGVLLDRYGARRVESALLVIAGLGALGFAFADSMAGLTAARALIGLGVSACLMAAFKANILWWPIERLPLMNGLILTCGGIGALTASTPVAALLSITDWRGVFVVLAVLMFACSGWLLVSLKEPPQPRPEEPETLVGQIAVLGQIFGRLKFWRVAAGTVPVQSVGMAYLSLWAAEWARVVDGASETMVAITQQNMAIGMTLGYAVTGVVTDRLARIGVRSETVLAAASGLFIANLACLVTPGLSVGWAQWPLFAMFCTSSVLGYAILSHSFPGAVAGRVNTALNLLTFVLAFAVQSGAGGAIDLLVAGGFTVADAHHWVLVGLLLYCTAGYLVFIAPWLSGLVWRRGHSQVPGE
ncbi:MAG: MFS transporter [Rhodospirillaceae bacterium]|nr:MFS transporter [Rhodospirillaceae bacterium]